MNPFRPNQPEHVTGQDLLALHLNELPAARAAAIRRIVAQDPALAAESASIAAALSAVSGNALAAPTPMPLDAATLDRNWQALRPKLVSFGTKPSSWRLPAIAGLLAATAAGLGLFACVHRPAAPDLRPTQATLLTPTTPRHPILTATPQPEPEDLHPSFTSGVYRPKPHAADNPIHFIGLAPQHTLTANSPTTQPFRQPPITLFPTPPLTLEPSFLAAIPTQIRPQLRPDSAQAPNLKPNPHTKPRHPIDLMLGVGGTFIPAHDSLTAGSEPRTLTISHAIAAIGAIHQQFRPVLGYRLTLSYTRPDFAYTYSSGSSATPGTGFSDSGTINTRIFEAAGTYVIQGPHHKRLTTSADAGGALLAFLPSATANPAASYAYRGAGVLGVNLDYAITPHLGARIAYRAQLFKSPDFRYSGATIPVTTPLVVDDEPSLGVTYTFGKR